MSIVALVCVPDDEEQGVELQTQLVRLGLRVVMFLAQDITQGSRVKPMSGLLHSADAVLQLWSRHAEYSDSMAEHGAQASDQQKLLIVRLDSTALPARVNAVVVELRGRGVDRAGIDAIRVALEAIRADRLERGSDAGASPHSDQGGPASPE